MARMYKPNAPFDAPMKILIPTDTMVKGVKKKVFPNPETLSNDYLFFGSFRTFGGTENFSNNVYTVYNTAIIDTWYRPDITSECQIYLCDTGEIFNVITEPENIDMRHQYMQFKVEKVGGKT